MFPFEAAVRMLSLDGGKAETFKHEHFKDCSMIHKFCRGFFFFASIADHAGVEHMGILPAICASLQPQIALKMDTLKCSHLHLS